MPNHIIFNPDGGGPKPAPRTWGELTAVLFAIALTIFAIYALNWLVAELDKGFRSPTCLTYFFVAISALVAGLGVYALRQIAAGLEIAGGVAMVTTAIFPSIQQEGLPRLILAFGGIRLIADGVKRIRDLRCVKLDR